jgi:hypothetical protein
MSTTQSLLFPQSVRQRVLDQHGRLRELLGLALTASAQALQGSRCDLLTLARLTRETELRFRAHLAFEESALAPVLARADLWGPERVAALHEEHGRQREELHTLVEGIESGWTPDVLAVALRSLVTDLLLDMDEEERGCLQAAVFDDDVISAAEASTRP